MINWFSETKGLFVDIIKLSATSSKEAGIYWNYN